MHNYTESLEGAPVDVNEIIPNSCKHISKG